MDNLLHEIDSLCESLGADSRESVRALMVKMAQVKLGAVGLGMISSDQPVALNNACVLFAAAYLRVFPVHEITVVAKDIGEGKAFMDDVFVALHAEPAFLLTRPMRRIRAIQYDGWIGGAPRNLIMCLDPVSLNTVDLYEFVTQSVLPCLAAPDTFCILADPDSDSADELSLERLALS